MYRGNWISITYYYNVRKKVKVLSVDYRRTYGRFKINVGIRTQG